MLLTLRLDGELRQACRRELRTNLRGLEGRAERIVEIAPQYLGLARGLLVHDALRILRRRRPPEVGNEYPAIRTGDIPDGLPQDLRPVQLMQQAVAHDELPVFRRQIGGREYRVVQSDSPAQPGVPFQLRSSQFQHRPRSVDAGK